MSKAFERAKALVSGRKPFDELCRDAAHNLAERQAINAELRSGKMSVQRRQWLLDKRRDLFLEKGLIEKKYQRIKQHVVSEHQFII